MMQELLSDTIIEYCEKIKFLKLCCIDHTNIPQISQCTVQYAINSIINLLLIKENVFRLIEIDVRCDVTVQLTKLNEISLHSRH